MWILFHQWRKDGCRVKVKSTSKKHRAWLAVVCIGDGAGFPRIYADAGCVYCGVVFPVVLVSLSLSAVA